MARMYLSLFESGEKVAAEGLSIDPASLSCAFEQVRDGHKKKGKVLYPLLRVEIPEIKIERVGNLRPGLLGPVSVEPLDLEIDGHFRSLTTAKGDGLAKLTPQLLIGAL